MASSRLAPRLAVPAQRPRNGFPGARSFERPDADAALPQPYCIVADLALDDEDRLAVAPLRGGSDAIKPESANVHRQAKPGIKSRGLRHGPDQVGAPADNGRIGDDQPEDDNLQTRQRQPPRFTPRSAAGDQSWSVAEKFSGDLRFGGQLDMNAAGQASRRSRYFRRFKFKE